LRKNNPRNLIQVTKKLFKFGFFF